MEKILFLSYGLQLAVFAVIDGRQRRIPNRNLAFALILFGLIYGLAYVSESTAVKGSLLMGFVLRFRDATIFFIFFLLFQLITKSSLGMGDVKLLFVHFLYLARSAALVSLLISLLALVLFFMALHLGTRLSSQREPSRKDYPFAPFLFSGYLLLGMLLLY